MDSARNLILGTSFKSEPLCHSFRWCEPFSISARRFSQKADIVLLVEDLGLVDRCMLHRLAVETISFGRLFKAKEIQEHALFKFYNSNIGSLSAVARRAIAYYFYLQQNHHYYERILLCDVWDVVFQQDPFSIACSDNAMCCFLENGKLTIGRDETNSLWVWQQFGNAGLERLRDKPIVNAGVILGTPQVLVRYLEKMITLFKSVSDKSIIHDQATHNFIIHTSAVSPVRMFTNEEGPVLHLRLLSGNELRMNAQGRLVNLSGREVVIVHQYPQHPSLAEKIEAQYKESFNLGFIRRYGMAGILFMLKGFLLYIVCIFLGCTRGFRKHLGLTYSNLYKKSN
jgi:hypothetical protein